MLNHEHEGHTHMGMTQCIDACVSCERSCLEAIHHCLTTGGEHAAAMHITSLMDCVEMCALSARFMLRGSEMHVETCRVCAEVCTACAVSCESLADDAMKRCADVCRRCATECHKMAMA